MADLVGNKRKDNREKQEPFWKRMRKQIRNIERDITRLRQWNVDKLESVYWKVRLERKYYVKNKGMAIEELKQRVKSNKRKNKKYDARNDTFHQNRLFEKKNRGFV